MHLTTYHLTVLNKDPPGNVWIWLRSCVTNRTGHLRAFYTFWPLQIVPHFLSGGNITSKLQSHNSLISSMFLLKYQRISSFFLFWWIVQFSTLIPRPSKTCEVLYQAVGSHHGKVCIFGIFCNKTISFLGSTVQPKYWLIIIIAYQHLIWILQSDAIFW